MWDINTLREIDCIGGMENAVTAAAIDDTTIITTSTGVKDASDSVTGYCVRLWNKHQLVKTQRDHYASIRCCCPFYLRHVPSTEYPGAANGFVTGGNDGKMIVYDSCGNKMEACETSPNVT